MLQLVYGFPTIDHFTILFTVQSSSVCIPSMHLLPSGSWPHGEKLDILLHGRSPLPLLWAKPSVCEQTLCAACACSRYSECPVQAAIKIGAYSEIPLGISTEGGPKEPRPDRPCRNLDPKLAGHGPALVRRCRAPRQIEFRTEIRPHRIAKTPLANKLAVSALRR